MANESSSNYANLARPYALAAFEYAREKQQLSAWKTFLELAGTIAKQKSVREVLGNPEVPSQKLFDLFHDILAPQLDSGRNNFLLLVSQKKRLAVLHEISEQFNNHYAALEKVSKVRVITAIEAQEDFRKKLTEALKKRTQRDVTLHCEVDPSIIGGAIIQIGDRVIDGSIRGKLNRLLQDLKD